MTITLPNLPYPADALEPHVSAKTLGFHHGKHHKAYVDKLNAAIADSEYEGQTLETIIAASHKAADTGVFNNAAQAWNHTFLWNSMSPNGGREPEGALAEAINQRFGDRIRGALDYGKSGTAHRSMDSEGSGIDRVFQAGVKTD